MIPDRVKLSDLLSNLPDEWPLDLRPEIWQQIQDSRRKVVVLDDDPTGTQTVHGIEVFTKWPVVRLAEALTTDAPAFYILTNSRSLPLSEAQELNAAIGRNLAEAGRLAGRQFVVVSRSDSTLRGHFPAEVHALADSLPQPFDGWIINPFFLEGGRYTIGDVHYVQEGEWLIPAAETEFARDSVFGYHASNLRDWVQEKTNGEILSQNVASISIDDIRQGGPQQVAERLMTLTDCRVCIVNAASYRDIEVLVAGILTAEANGKSFLYRSAASIVQVRAGIPPRPLLKATDLDLPESGGGLIIVGSYVPKTTKQVENLVSRPGRSHIEIDVRSLIEGSLNRREIERAVMAADEALGAGRDAVLITSRKLITGKGTGNSLSIGQKISNGLIAILAQISERPRYILAKGGITSSDVATKGLNVEKALVRGQILPGVPVWQLGDESRYPGLTYIVFPGNVGGADALAGVVDKLS